MESYAPSRYEFKQICTPNSGKAVSNNLRCWKSSAELTDNQIGGMMLFEDFEAMIVGPPEHCEGYPSPVSLPQPS